MLLTNNCIYWDILTLICTFPGEVTQPFSLLPPSLKRINASRLRRKCPFQRKSILTCKGKPLLHLELILSLKSKPFFDRILSFREANAKSTKLSLFIKNVGKTRKYCHFTLIIDIGQIWKGFCTTIKLWTAIKYICILWECN